MKGSKAIKYRRITKNRRKEAEKVMATLKSIFKLYDGYSSTISVINKKTNDATNKILKASGATDNFNKKLKATGASAGAASSDLGKLISLAALAAGAIKGMNIADEFTNTSSRLGLINDGLQTQAELQDKIFAAADRSKGVYKDMAGAISKMGLLASDAFGSNDELISFTELLQKSFKISGASTTEQSSALLQLSQAMAAGRLQGDEFRSIMENAPMLADAIAKFTGKSKGELKEMSAEGTITADIIKNALFMAGDDINAKFETLPMTFGDVWNKIKNGALKAFQPVIEKVNSLINTPGFAKAIDNIINGINLIATGIGKVIGFVQDNWSIIEPILYGIMGALAAIAFMYLPAIIIQSLAVTWPILLIGAAIGLLIYAMIKFGDVTAEVFGYIGGGIGVLIACIYNMIAAVWNGIMLLGDFVMNFFIDLINGVISGINLAIGALNNIPGVNIGMVGEIQRVETQKLDYMGLDDAWTKGQDIGRSVGGSLSGLGDKLSALVPGGGNTSNDLSAYMVDGSLPVTGKVDIKMSDEDLKSLKDIAERDYINKFSTATLAPRIQVTFGDVHEEADVNKLYSRVKKILHEGIATAAEGSYA
jgi:tape measure domain-containing protein